MVWGDPNPVTLPGVSTSSQSSFISQGWKPPEATRTVAQSLLQCTCRFSIPLEGLSLHRIQLIACVKAFSSFYSAHGSIFTVALLARVQRVWTSLLDTSTWTTGVGWSPHGREQWPSVAPSRLPRMHFRACHFRNQHPLRLTSRNP
jgi:hypothetical protein